MKGISGAVSFALLASVVLVGLGACDCPTRPTLSVVEGHQAIAGSDGPLGQGPEFPRQDGDASGGRDVFRFEMFGNEGFWTDAVRLQAQM